MAFSAKVEQLANSNFRVVCDGFELRKPILLPTNPELKDFGSDFKPYILNHSAEVEGHHLQLTGYLFHQRTQIQPSQLQGVLLRLRNVAIGSHDRSLLGFPGVPGPMASQITGEIYVESGLDEAMNIDRGSFRESDPVYRELQRYLFAQLVLRNGTEAILPDIRRRSRERMLALRAQQARQQTQDRLTSFARRLSKLLTHDIRINLVDDTSFEPLRVDEALTVIDVFAHHPVFDASQAKRVLLMEFLIAYEIAAAMRPGDRDFLMAILRQS